MKPQNTVKFTFPSKSVNESFARGAVASFAAQADPSVADLADLKTAVSEAVTNCTVHAYRDEVGPVTLTVSLYADGRLTVVVADKGCGIENVEQAMQPMYTTGGEDRAGLGFAVMESFMDKVRVHSRVGKGTRVTLTKWLGGRETSST